MGIDLGRLWTVILALVIFGIGYNTFVEWAERKGYLEGYMGFVVAGGVFITLCGFLAFDWRCFLLGIAFFTASGTSMMLGSVIRHIQAREASQKAIRDEATNDQA